MNLNYDECQAYQEVKRVNDSFQLSLSNEKMKSWVIAESEKALKRQYYNDLTEILKKATKED